MVIEGEKPWESPKQPEHPELTCFRETFTAMRASKPINDGVAMARSTMLAILGRMATHSGPTGYLGPGFQFESCVGPQELRLGRRAARTARS